MGDTTGPATWAIHICLILTHELGLPWRQRAPLPFQEIAMSVSLMQTPCTYSAAVVEVPWMISTSFSFLLVPLGQENGKFTRFNLLWIFHWLLWCTLCTKLTRWFFLSWSGGQWRQVARIHRATDSAMLQLRTMKQCMFLEVMVSYKRDWLFVAVGISYSWFNKLPLYLVALQTDPIDWTTLFDLILLCTILALRCLHLQLSQSFVLWSIMILSVTWRSW